MMSKLAACAVTVFLLAEPVTVSAQQNLAPTVFGDKHQSEYGNFSHWSAVFQKDPTRIEIEYAVCNFDKATALIYRWNGPNIGVGDGGTLPVGKCHILRRDVAAIEHDRSAFIAFTQAGRKHPAPAHLSKIEVLPPGVVGVLPRVITNSLRTFYGPEANNSQPSLADLVVTQFRDQKNGEVQHIINWYPPTVSLAIGITAFGGVQPDGLAGTMKAAGYNVEVSDLKSVLADSSLQFVPPERLRQPVILLTKTDKSPPVLQLRTGEGTQVISSSNAMLIDTASRKLVSDVEISVFGK